MPSRQIMLTESSSSKATAPPLLHLSFTNRHPYSPNLVINSLSPATNSPSPKLATTSLNLVSDSLNLVSDSPFNPVTNNRSPATSHLNLVTSSHRLKLDSLSSNLSVSLLTIQISLPLLDKLTELLFPSTFPQILKSKTYLF